MGLGFAMGVSGFYRGFIHEKKALGCIFCYENELPGTVSEP